MHTMYDTRSLLLEPILGLFDFYNLTKQRVYKLCCGKAQRGINYTIRSFDVIKMFGTKSHHIQIHIYRSNYIYIL